MYIEEAEDLRLRVPKRMPNRSRLQWRVLWQLDDHFHAYRPLVLSVTVRHAKPGINLPTYGSHRPIAYHCESSVYVHSGHVSGLRISGAIYALICQPHPDHRVAVEQRL